MLQLLSSDPYSEEYNIILERLNIIAEEVLELYSNGCVE